MDSLHRRESRLSQKAWRRTFTLLALFALVPLGLWLRFRAPVLEAIRDGSGGAVYVVFWAFCGAFLWPAASPLRVAGTSLLATCCVEFSQQWHPPWLDRLRATFPGRLVLGTTFDWGDFPPYFCGAVIAWAALWLIQRRTSGAARN